MKRNKVVHYGVSKRYDNRGGYDKYVEEIYYSGCTIIPNAIEQSDVLRLSGLIDDLYLQQVREMGGNGDLELIKDSDIVRCPLKYSNDFVNLSKNTHVLKIAQMILGENILLMMQNAIINRPSELNHQTLWHRDLNYQHWTSSKPMSLNALFVIDSFTLESGCTHVLPGTHLREELPSDEYILNHEKPVIANSGSVIILDAMLYHRAGVNTSPNLRRAVNHVIGLPFFGQQINIPDFVENNLAVDSFSAGYFGYRWNPAKSAKSWRDRKIFEKKRAL